MGFQTRLEITYDGTAVDIFNVVFLVQAFSILISISNT